MPVSTGRWVNRMQWQCPRCAWVNDDAAEACQRCGQSVRPPAEEPVRPPDPLDLIGHDESRVAVPGAGQLAVNAIQTLTRATREKAMALFGQSLRTELKNHGERGAQASQAIAEMPESDQRAALGSLVDDLEREGFALYSIRGHQPD
jgi:hypothetical protein